MTRDEALKIITMIKASYPNAYNSFDENDIMLSSTIWAVQFAQTDYNAVYKATNYYLSVGKFPPTIADIKEIINDMLSDDPICSDEQAWTMIKRSGRCDPKEAREEWEKLPEHIQRIITPGTLTEIGRASEKELSFMKNGIMKSYGSMAETLKKQRSISSISDKVKLLETDSTKRIGYEGE